MHAYQSLACETAINTECSELFSLKHIYVKYKNAILSHIDCFLQWARGWFAQSIILGQAEIRLFEGVSCCGTCFSLAPYTNLDIVYRSWKDTDGTAGAI